MHVPRASRTLLPVSSPRSPLRAQLQRLRCLNAATCCLTATLLCLCALCSIALKALTAGTGPAAALVSGGFAGGHHAHKIVNTRPAGPQHGRRPPPDQTHPQPQLQSPLSANLVAHTLVLYSFRNDDPEAAANLRFFVEHGMHGCGACEYIVVVSPDPPAAEVDLPRLPAGARYEHRTGNCHGWGVYSWLLEHNAVHIGKYSYFVLISSAVRGPFLPPYLKDKIHFTAALTSRLVGDVKLVGPTISCEAPAPLPSGERARNPHVQASAVATDAAGMRLLLRGGPVFECHATAAEAVVRAELGASAAILAAGYNLDCFMGRYQGVDWRDSEVWGCNGGENPMSAARVDDVGLAPMELMFVPVRRNMLQLRYPVAVAAAAYDAWYQDTDAPSMHVAQKGPASERFWEARAPFALAMAAVGPQCFDCEFYTRASDDLSDVSCWNAFIHFVNHGQFEMRPHRFTCETPLKDRAVPFAPADDGQAWPRITQAGCNADACAPGAAGGAVEELRAAAGGLWRQVEALRAQRDALKAAPAGAAGAAGDGRRSDRL